jgi:hypothetical protein
MVERPGSPDGIDERQHAELCNRHYTIVQCSNFRRPLLLDDLVGEQGGARGPAAQVKGSD